MARYSREEMEEAFQRYQDVGLAAARSGDWSKWGEIFTEDCSYHEHCLGQWGGREAVTREMAAIMHVTERGQSVEHIEGPARRAESTSNPYFWINQYPVFDYVIDTDRGWVWSLIWQRLDDPGNGQVFQCNCLSLLYYAGDGKFSFEEDLYNPNEFKTMLDGWLKTRAECEAKIVDPTVREARTAAARAVALEQNVPAPDLSMMRPEHRPIGEVPAPVGRYSRDEIEDAFKNFQRGLALAGKTNDWRHWGACLTTDTTLIDCELGHLGKRDALVREIGRRLERVDEERPWAYLNHFPIGEYVIDDQRDSVWTFLWARFRDPGNGTRHEAKIFMRMVYGGDGLFKEIETLYNPFALYKAMKTWKKAKADYDAHREKREKELAELAEKAQSLAPLKLDEHGREIR